MNRAKRCRDFAATINNPEGAPDFSLSLAKVSYCAYNEEVGAEGTHHFQVFIYFENAISWKAAKKNVGLIFGKENPHVKQVQTSIEDNIHYCTKPCEDPDCQTKGCKEVREGKSQVLSKNEYGTRPQQGERKDLGNKDFTTAINLAKEGRTDAAKEYLIRKRPRDWILNAPKIAAALEDLAPKKYKHAFGPEDFNIPLETDFSKCIFFLGPTECGKTHYAAAHFENPLIVSDIDDLKGVKWHLHDGIVFDDCSFSHWPGDSIIKLLDMDLDRSIHCRYVNAKIPKGMRRIFTHNNADIFSGPLVSELQAEAINRRCRVVRIQGDVRKPKTN